MPTVALVCVLSACGHESTKDEPWVLPGFQFQDSQDAIYITGTLKGEDVGYPVNTWQIDCFKTDAKCRVADVEEIGTRQLGQINIADWPVTSWTDQTITVDSGDTTSCGHQIIVINRVAETVTYTNSPQNQDKDYCKGWNKFMKREEEPTYNWEIGRPNQPWGK